MNGHGCVPIKLCLQKQETGQIQPVNCNLLTPNLEQAIETNSFACEKYVTHAISLWNLHFELSLGIQHCRPVLFLELIGLLGRAWGWSEGVYRGIQWPEALSGSLPSRFQGETSWPVWAGPQWWADKREWSEIETRHFTRISVSQGNWVWCLEGKNGCVSRSKLGTLSSSSSEVS